LFAILGLFSGTAVQRFDAARGEPLGTPRRLGKAAGTVLVARDGRRIVTSIQDGPTVVRDARTLRPLRTLPVRATAVALSPDDRTLIAGARDGTVRFVDLTSNRVRVAGRHDGAVAEIAVSRDGRAAATGGEDNRVQVWDVERAASRESFSGHTTGVTGLAFSEDARTLFSAALDGTILIWDLAGDRRLDRRFAITPFQGRPGSPHYLFATPLSYDTSPDGRTLALGGEYGIVSLIDARTLRLRSRHRVVGSSIVSSVGYLPDGRLLVSDEVGSATMLNPRTGAVGRSLSGFGAAATPSLSRDGRVMASVGAGGTVNIRKLRAGRPAGRPRVYLRDAAAVALSPDGRSIAMAGFNNVEIGDVASLRRRTRLPDSGGYVTVRYSPDGRFLTAGALDGSVRVWSTKTWRSQRFRAQTGAVLHLTVSPDSGTLATGGDDGVIRLFDLPSQRLLGILPAVPNRFAAPLFTRDGASLFVITDAGVAYRWDIRAASWARHACAVAGRSLTRTEWSEELPGLPYAPAC
jgi:WD40 repeat protein